MLDPFYILNQIQVELNNLNRGHVYYSIDKEPEVCAALIAEGIRGYKSSEGIKVQMAADFAETIKGLGHKMGEAIAKGFSEGLNLAKEEIYGHRVSVTVQSWEDVPAAIGLIRERQREFKRKHNL